MRRRSRKTTGEIPAELPIPPLEMRRLVGPTDPAAFDNPTGGLTFPTVDADRYESVLDFGCGCGRVARRLIQQRVRPARYLGIDIHAGMIGWCQANLAPHAPGFSFVHHDVFAAGLNPGRKKPRVLPFPAADASMTMAIAISVFTHLVEEQIVHYLHEMRRVLRPDGVLVATFFLFDKSGFPMMQEFQNALYINHLDPTNAVIVDRDWLRATAGETGLVAVAVGPPEVRGFQWTLHLTPDRPGIAEAEWPADEADIGLRRPPLLPPHAERIGRTS
jgi:SAM-dependent methyltransferase